MTSIPRRFASAKTSSITGSAPWLVADRALSERRNIVTEIIGAEEKPARQLVDALGSIDYAVHLVLIKCDDIQEAKRRNMSRGDDNISAYYAEPFQRTWIIDACNKLANNRKV